MLCGYLRGFLLRGRHRRRIGLGLLGLEYLGYGRHVVGLCSCGVGLYRLQLWLGLVGLYVLWG